MIEEALIVAELDAALYRQHHRWHAVRLENGVFMDCARDLSALLAHPAEKRLLNPAPSSVADLKSALAAWSKRHELLHFLLMGMDAVLGDDTRLEALALAEDGLQHPDLTQFATARLFGCPLPAVADLDNAVKLSAHLPNTLRLYQNLEHTQAFILPVRRTLENLVRFDFDLSCDADDLIPAMVDEGVVATAVFAVTHQDKTQAEELLFKFADNQALKTLEPRLRVLLTKFTKELISQFDFKAKEVLKHTELHDDPIAEEIEAWKSTIKRQKKPDKHKKSADQYRQNNDKQKDYILKLIQQGKQAQAQTAVREMVQNHRHSGELKHLCKSLSDLAARVLALGYPELAVDFYHYAKLANSSDVVVYTGYAETLRALNRPDEALAAYASAKTQFPENAVCHTGYAETLRALNRPDEALAAYDTAKTRFPRDAVCHTGYAETLRALNRLDEALEAYDAAQTLFPHDQVLRNAKACLLIQLERYPEARKLLPVNGLGSEQTNRDYHVLAMSYFYEGEFATAESMLRRGVGETIGQAKQVFETSLAVLLLKQRKASEVLQQWQGNLAQLIQFPKQRVIYAHALAECNRLEEAEAQLNLLEKSPAPVIEIKQFMRQRYWSADSPAEQAQLDEALYHHELDLVLFAAYSM